MGIASKLFFKQVDNRDTLAWRIKPSDEQQQEQMERWNDLRDHLVEDLNERSSCTIYTWLQGSYKFGTQIRPPRTGSEFDIDLGVYFLWSGKPNDGLHSPSDLRDFVQDSCSEYSELETNDATSVAELKPRCSRVHFDQDFHIDVPSYHLDRSRDARALAAESNQWENSDPKAIYKWWKDKTLEDRYLARRMVRYIKMWTALTFVDYDFSPSSIMITVLVAEALSNVDLEKSQDDDDLLYTILVLIRDRLQASSRVSNPVNEYENINRLTDVQHATLMEEIDEFIGIAKRALEESTAVASAEVWSEVFEHFFPVPSNEESDEELRKASFFESHSLATIAFDPQILVEATSGSRKFRGQNKIGPIPKGCSIQFSLFNTWELPIGADIVWTVRNEGKEAEDLNDLGHRHGSGVTTSESSAYKGKHSMDVTVKLNGQLIGRRRVPVEVTGMGMPPRNPRKPSWTQLR